VPQARLLEARNTVEQLKAVELEDYFQDDCVAGQLAKQKDIDAIAPRTAVLYPIVLPDRLEMLVGLAGGIRQMTLPIGAAALTEQALGYLDDAWRVATPNTPIPYSPPLEEAFLPGPKRIADEIRRRLR